MSSGSDPAGRSDMNMLFETERLIVRRFKAEDARQLYENHIDEEVRKWFPNECYADLKEAQDAIRFYADCVDHNKLPYVLGVEQDSDKATALYPKAAVLKARRPSMPLSG